MALVCNDDLLRERLVARPGWRRSGSAVFLEQMVAFNRWFWENGQRTEPEMELLDTSALSVRETARRVAGWVQTGLQGK